MRRTGRRTAALASLAALALAAAACRKPAATPPAPSVPPPPAPSAVAPPVLSPVPAPSPVPPSAPSAERFPDLRPGAGVSQPRPVENQTPPVPARCVPLSIEGADASFVFEVGLTEEGRVSGVRTLRRPRFSPPCPEFEPAWQAAIRGWRYAPALREGRPVAVTVRVSIDFRQ